MPWCRRKEEGRTKRGRWREEQNGEGGGKGGGTSLGKWLPQPHSPAISLACVITLPPIPHDSLPCGASPDLPDRPFSLPALRAPHTLPWGLPFLCSVCPAPALTICLLESFPPSPGQTTWPSHPSGPAPHLTIRPGPLLSPQGLCRAPGSPVPGSAKPGAQLGRSESSASRWDQPGSGIQEGFLEEEV